MAIRSLNSKYASWVWWYESRIAGTWRTAHRYWSRSHSTGSVTGSTSTGSFTRLGGALMQMAVTVRLQGGANRR